MHTHTHTHTYTQTKQKLRVIPSQCYNPLDTKSHQHVLQKPISAIKIGDINFHLNTFEEWRHYGANDQCISYKMNMPVQLTTKIMTRESRNWLGEPWIANKIIQHTRKWLPSDKLWGGGVGVGDGVWCCSQCLPNAAFEITQLLTSPMPSEDDAAFFNASPLPVWSICICK